jgi:hypothetical protein
MIFGRRYRHAGPGRALDVDERLKEIQCGINPLEMATVD